MSGVSGFFSISMSMAYKVIARKFRPQTFEEVVGQTHVTRTLVNSIRDGRIAHAFLFAGERGVGKTSIARILAKALNCHTGRTDRPCGTCPSCQEIAAGTSIDVHEIDGASNRGVDDIRALRENVRYLPTRDRYKIFIIDEVHMLTDQAFNALLKTLEEPPPHVVFILATTEPQKIPDTIISRCLRFDFRRIPIKDIITHLEHISRQEKIEVSKQGLYLIAREAEGSMRDAQSILERAVSYCGMKIQESDLQEMLGHVDRRQLFTILDGLVAGDPHACITGLARLYEAGIDLKRCYYAFLELLRDLLMIKTLPAQAGLVEASDEDLRQLQHVADRISAEGLQRCFRLWFAAENDVVRSASPKTALEVCLLEMLQVKDSVPVDELILRIEQLQGQMEKKQTFNQGGAGQHGSSTVSCQQVTTPFRHSQQVTSAPEPPRSGEVSPESLLAFIAQKDYKFSTYFQQASVTVSSEGTVTVQFPPNNIFFDHIKDPESERKLRALCQEYLGRSVNLVVRAQPDREKKNDKDRCSPEQMRKQHEQQVLHNPVIQNVLKMFNGKIVAIHTAE